MNARIFHLPQARSAHFYRLSALLAALTMAALLTTGCNRDRRDIERSATWVCERMMLEQPDEKMLSAGEDLANYISAEDMSFLQSEEAAKRGDEDPFDALAEAFGVVLEPAVRALVEAMRSETRCVVEILSVEDERARVHVSQDTPNMDGVGLGALGKIGELAAHDSHEKRVAAARAWLTTMEGRVKEEHEIVLRKEEGRWRIHYGLEAKARAEAEALAARVRAEAVAELRTRIEALEAHRSKLETEIAERERTRQALSAFEVSQARFYRRNTGFMTEPVIDMRVKNGTEHAISRAYFKGVVASPGRAVPWIEEDFNYSIRGGLEPGEEARWRLSPNMFSAWGTRVPAEAELAVTVLRLDGPDGEPLYDLQEQNDRWDFRTTERDRYLPKSPDAVEEEIARLEVELAALGE